MCTWSRHCIGVVLGCALGAPCSQLPVVHNCGWVVEEVIQKIYRLVVEEVKPSVKEVRLYTL